MELNEIFYQHYWWFLISTLGALLVFLLFVQGGQTLLSTLAKEPIERSMLVNSLGRKWEFTFTTLVVPSILFYEFRRRILVVDGYLVQLYHTSCLV